MEHSWLKRLGRNHYFRIGAQVGTGTGVLMAALSAPSVWNALSLDPILANPSLVLLLFSITLLISRSSGLAPLQLAGESCAGAVLGGGLGLASIYAAVLANGGSHTSVTKAAVDLVLSGSALFVLTLYRFKYKRWTLLFYMASLTLGMAAAASYHSVGQQYKFTLHWLMYAAIGNAAALLCTTLVLPVPAGAIIRKSLAKGLRSWSLAVSQALDIMTQEVREDGLLALASGETHRRHGIDSGLYPQVSAIYKHATKAGGAIQNAYRHLGAARLELDLYRRQRLLPAEPFRLLTVLERSVVSTSMMLVYPLQSGKMHCGLCRRMRAPLLRLAASLRAVADAVAAVLEDNAPLGAALGPLREVEASFATLSAAARDAFREGGVLTQNVLALDMVLSLLFTVCTRVRRLYLLLPGALGQDQPGAAALVLAHFHSAAAWDFERMTQLPPSRSNSLDLLRASLLSTGIGLQPKRTPSAQALELVAQPDLKTLMQQQQDEEEAGEGVALKEGRRLLAAAGRAWAATGFSHHHLKLGIQMAVGYAITFILMAITPINNALGGRLYWAIFVQVAILEPSTGGVVIKGAQRLVGTVLGGLAGLGATYFVVLCNGLTYDNHPRKFILMTCALSVLAGLGSAAVVKFKRYAYCFIIAVVILCVVALPGYSTDSPMPTMALWRVATTGIGVALEVLVAALVFPVTARDIFKDIMASTLEQLSGIAGSVFHSVLPGVSRRRLVGPAAGAGYFRPGPAQEGKPGVRHSELQPKPGLQALELQPKPGPQLLELQPGEAGLMELQQRYPSQSEPVEQKRSSSAEQPASAASGLPKQPPPAGAQAGPAVHRGLATGEQQQQQQQEEGCYPLVGPLNGQQPQQQRLSQQQQRLSQEQLPPPPPPPPSPQQQQQQQDSPHPHQQGFLHAPGAEEPLAWWAPPEGWAYDAPPYPVYDVDGEGAKLHPAPPSPGLGAVQEESDSGQQPPAGWPASAPQSPTWRAPGPGLGPGGPSQHLSLRSASSGGGGIGKQPLGAGSSGSRRSSWRACPAPSWQASTGPSGDSSSRQWDGNGNQPLAGALLLPNHDSQPAGGSYTSPSHPGSRAGSQRRAVLGVGFGQGVTAASRGAGSRHSSSKGTLLPTVGGSSSLERTLSGASSAGGQSVYVPLAATSQRVFGSAYMRVVPPAMQAGEGIVSMLTLETALKSEIYPFQHPHRFPLEPGYRSQRLCRHMLNVLVTFSISVDAHEGSQVPVLVPHAARVHSLVRQLQECLQAFAGLVRGSASLASALELVASLEQHAVRLFLAVLLAEQLGQGEGPAVSEPELVQGLAFLAMMFNAAYVARMLCGTLAQTFCAVRPADRAQLDALLRAPPRWAVDDAVMLVASGVMGIAIGGAAATAPETPRTGGPAAGGAAAAWE